MRKRRAAAKERQGRPGAERPGKLPKHKKGKPRDIIAKATGKSDAASVDVPLFALLSLLPADW
jgi:hypothetical protein